MKRTIFKRVISVILAAIMLASCFVYEASAAYTGISRTEAEARAVLDDIMREFPVGSHFTKDGNVCSHSATSTCNNCKLSGVLGRSDVTASCANSGIDKGLFYSSCWTCQAFASYCYTRCFGLPAMGTSANGKYTANKYSTVTKLDAPTAASLRNLLSAAKPGDLIYISTIPHWIVFYGFTSDGITYIDNNGDLNGTGHSKQIVDKTTVTYTKLASKGKSGYISLLHCKYYSGTSSPAPESTKAVSWNNLYVSDIKQTSAVVKADLSANTGALKTIGLQMCKDGGTLATVASWPVGSVLNYCYVNCDGGEAPALSAGTKYNYRFFVIRTDGTYEYSDQKSFTTAAPAAVSAIRWDSVTVSSITATTAVVKADVTATTSQIKTIGLQLCKSGGSLSSVASWPVGSVLNYCYVNCDGSEGPTLSPNTTYQYRFYIIRNDGTYEYSDTKSFTTLSGTSSAITWDNVYVSDVTETSAMVKADVTAKPSQLKTIGLQLCREGGQLSTVASWPVGSILNYCYVNCDGSEGPKLSPGTKYYYCFYIVKTDGSYEYSTTKSFTTSCSHSYNSGVITKAADCTSDGIRTYTCTKCGVTKTETIHALGHSYQQTLVLPTCQAQGYTVYQCTRCDSGYKDNYTPKTAHVYLNGVCTVCGSKTEVSPFEGIYEFSEPYKNSIYYMMLNQVELTGDQRIDIVSIARSQIGYQEGLSYEDLDGCLNNGQTQAKNMSYLSGSKYLNYQGYLDSCEYNYWRWSGPTGGRYISSLQKTRPAGASYDVSTYDRAWCATFVAWCARMAGIPTSIISNSTFASPQSGCMNVPYFEKGSYTPRAGDLIYFGTTAWNHVGIIESVDGTTITYIDGNGDDNVSRHTTSITSSDIRAFGVPNYNGTSDIPAITWNKIYAANITRTSAIVKADVTANTGLLKTIGLEMCKEGGTFASVASWPVGSILNYCYVNCDGSEAPPLSPATTYQYRFYVIKTDGSYEYSQTNTFTTTGNAQAGSPGTAITWDKVYVSDLSETSAVVKADVTAEPSRIKTIGLQMCRGGETLSSVASWPVNNVLNYCYVSCDGTEAERLSPGTTYDYCFYIVRTDDTMEFSAVQSFTTPCNHTFDDGVITKKATCTDFGELVYTCTKCGIMNTEMIERSAQHTWDEGTVTKEPTETQKGIRIFICVLCGATRTEDIPEGNHKHGFTASVVAPTCIKAGYTIYSCACGENYRDNYTDALGHSYINGICTRCGKEDPNFTPERPHSETCPSIQFPDSPAYGNWAHEGIDYCIEHELMNGVGNGLFNPNGTVTRAQLVTILYRVADQPEVTTAGTFDDVPAGTWYSKAIEWAAANSIVNGVGDRRFDPMGNITREQIATILYRYEGNPEVNGTLAAFPDSGNVHSYAENALIWATDKGLINGIMSGNVTNLAPQDNATRAQIASIIMRYLESRESGS